MLIWAAGEAARSVLVNPTGSGGAISPEYGPSWGFILARKEKPAARPVHMANTQTKQRSLRRGQVPDRLDESRTGYASEKGAAKSLAETPPSEEQASDNPVNFGRHSM